MNGAFMLDDKADNLDELARQYFVDELGLPPEEVPEAARNLLGAFDVLYRIDERLKNKQKV